MNSPGLPNFHHREGVKDLVLCLRKSCVIAYQQDTNNKVLCKALSYMFVDVVNPVVIIAKIQCLFTK